MSTQPEHTDRSEVLKWAEETGLENLKYRHENATALVREASTTLTLVLAGLGGSLAYAVKVFDPGPAGPVAVGAAALCGYLVVVAVGLVKGCLVVRPIPPVHNEPANLAQTQYSIDALREAELGNMQARIADVTERNLQSASRLNALRQAAIASPLVFVVAAITNWQLQPPAQRAPQRLVCQVGPAASASDRASVVCDLSQ